MLNIFKQIKQQKEEIERLKIEYDAARQVSKLYCGWTFAYKEAIWTMCQNGAITEDQKNLFFDEASKYHDLWLSQSQ